MAGFTRRPHITSVPLKHILQATIGKCIWLLQTNMDLKCVKQANQSMRISQTNKPSSSANPCLMGALTRTKKKCRNCQKEGHPVWAKTECTAYQARLEQREHFRGSLLVQAALWAQEKLSPLPPSARTILQPTSQKRAAPRHPSLQSQQTPRCGVGQPPAQETLRRQEERQTTIEGFLDTQDIDDLFLSETQIQDMTIQGNESQNIGH